MWLSSSVSELQAFFRPLVYVCVWFPELWAEAAQCQSLQGSPSTCPGWPRLHVEDQHRWCVLGSDPETKQHSSLCKGLQSPTPKKVCQVRRATKSLQVVFFHSCRVIKTEMLTPSTSATFWGIWGWTFPKKQSELCGDDNYSVQHGNVTGLCAGLVKVFNL